MEFDIATATAILKPSKLKKYFVINEHGVWPRVAPDDTENEVAEPSEVDMADLIFEQWRPAQELANDPHMQGLLPRKSVAQTPALPSNFNARELAAFMLYGYGTWVQSHYGNCRDWEAGPDPEMLKKIPPHQDIARSAVKEAFDAYLDAARAVVPRPLALYAEAELAREAWKLANNEANEREGVFAAMPGIEEAVARLERNVRRARAVASIAALDEAMKKTADDYNDAAEVWLKAMVRQLLLPAPKLAPATPGAVVAVEAVSVCEIRKAMDAPRFSMNRTALIDAHEHEWPAIRRDIADASTNGLAAAKAGAREWHEMQALEWARAKGRLKSAIKPAAELAKTMNSMASIQGRKHKLEG
jgi:hypothetical protein